ncbi:MAG: hypothetical protein U9N58_03785 [Thermodesulfobacteriota bacterium]|nr:hypothetical protein [Thermodesulfobacteriota bacterium]
MQDVEDFSRKTFDDSVSVEVTDALSWVKALNDKMGEGVKYSFTAVLFAVTALMMSFLRSVKLGLISMIPTVFPVLITLGLMGLAGIYLDMPLMCCSAVIIGVPWTIPYIFSGAIAGNSNVWATIRRPCGQRLARWDVRSPSPP